VYTVDATLSVAMLRSMNRISCAYCTDDAVGYDEENAPTCGSAAHCTVAVRPMPAIIEVSSCDDEDEDGDDDTEDP